MVNLEPSLIKRYDLTTTASVQLRRTTKSRQLRVDEASNGVPPNALMLTTRHESKQFSCQSMGSQEEERVSDSYWSLKIGGLMLCV